MSEEELIIRDNRKIDPVTGEARKPAGTATAGPTAGTATAPPTAEPAHEPAAEPAHEPAAEPGEGPKVDAALLDERTADLQRVQAEYANYRKRADRERAAAGDMAVGRVLAQLLPVVDDLDRARTHGDLAGPLKAVADKLESTFTKLGLVAFGAVGDPFDPAIHEAVLHDESDSVSVPTCTTVMRQGYRHAERLLRPAMVGVTDPLVFAPVEPAAADTPAETPDRETVPDPADAVTEH